MLIGLHSSIAMAYWPTMWAGE